MATIVFNRSYDGSTQEIHIGDVIDIQLEQGPTGYLWNIESVSNDNLVFQQKRMVSPPGKALGASGTIGFLFQAQKTGTTTIQLKRQRPWEKQATGEQSFHITLNIH